MVVQLVSDSTPQTVASDRERIRFNIDSGFCYNTDDARRFLLKENSGQLFFVMRRAIYPGSFDPVTNGHLDVIERAAKLFDEVLVAVAVNSQKQPLFTVAERLDLLARTTAAHGGKVRVVRFEGLLVDYARTEGAAAIIRGLRAVSDFEFEFQMALMNRKLNPGVETIFLMPREEYTYLSSRIIKEIARLGGEVGSFVPNCVSVALREKYPLPAKLLP